MRCKQNNKVSVDFNFLNNDYKSNYQRYNKLTFAKFKKFRTIEDAIHYSALALDINGRKFDHQYRLKNETLK